MKKHWKSMLAVGLSAVMLTSLMTPALAAGGNNGSLDIEKSENYIASFVDIGDTDLKDEVVFYKDAITKPGFFQDWVFVAYNIFESQKKSYWDHAGKGWDKDFGEGNYIDFVNDMQNARSTTGDGAMKSTGLSVAGSLKDVQTRAADDIAGLIDRQLTGDDFLEQHEIDGLSDLSQTVLYSTVSTIDRYGKTYQYGYSSFTIAFYDFQLHPLSDEPGIKESAVTTFTEGTPEDGFISLSENKGTTEITVTDTLENSITETVSTTLSESEQYSYGQMIGVDFGIGKDENLLHLNIMGNLTFEQVFSTAYSEENSIEKHKSKSTSVSSVLPAHTKKMGEQTTSTSTLTTTYDCPVGLTYKVAIFSMCGTCYDDNAATQSFSTWGYEQRSFVTFFGASDNAPDAVEDLYLRSEKHKDTSGYDATYGLTSGTNDDGDTWCRELNWNDIIKLGKPTSKKISISKDFEDILKYLNRSYPKSIDGGITTGTQETIITTEYDTMPLYVISTIRTSQPDPVVTMEVGDKKAIGFYNLTAENAYGVPYYGFNPQNGEWKIVDEKGKVIESPSDVIEIETDKVTGAKTLVAKKSGETYVKYFIPEKTYYTWDGVESTNEKIKAPIVRVKVTEEKAADAVSAELTGTVKVTVGERMHLDLDAENLTVAAYDVEGKAVDADLTWEAQESEGIVLTPDGGLTATAPGTYHIRAVSGNATSDWAEVTAEEPESLILYTCNHPFADVPHDAWYEPAVEYVYQNDIMNGVKETSFSPDGTMTRAMMAQVLYNLEKAPSLQAENPFSDVSEDAWYSDAVVWAAKNGLTTGVKGERFAPNDPVTREQLLAFICRYADWKGIELDAGTADLSKYQDADQISSWAKDYVVRGLGAGIVQGKSAAKLDPKGTASRAELAQVFMNLLDESV